MNITPLVNGFPVIEIEPLCGLIVVYWPYILANILMSLFIYVGYIVIRWKFREQSERLLFYIFMVSALQFGLNVMFFIMYVSPDNGILVIERKTI